MTRVGTKSLVGEVQQLDQIFVVLWRGNCMPEREFSCQVNPIITQVSCIIVGLIDENLKSQK